MEEPKTLVIETLNNFLNRPVARRLFNENVQSEDDEFVYRSRIESFIRLIDSFNDIGDKREIFTHIIIYGLYYNLSPQCVALFLYYQEASFMRNIDIDAVLREAIQLNGVNNDCDTFAMFMLMNNFTTVSIKTIKIIHEKINRSFETIQRHVVYPLVASINIKYAVALSPYYIQDETVKAQLLIENAENEKREKMITTKFSDVLFYTRDLNM